MISVSESEHETMKDYYSDKPYEICVFQFVCRYILFTQTN